MEQVTWRKEDKTAILTMCNGANRQNLAFAQAMNQAFDEVLADESITALVVTSDDVKNFSQGVDIEWLSGRLGEKDFDAVKSFMYAMNRVFRRLIQMPLPTIAAINGHAFGNGAMLACACDFRFMKKDRGFFCFPEVDLGIPFLPGMIAFVRKAVPEYLFNEMKLTGRRVTAEELERHHVLQKASADLDELMADVMAFASGFNKGRNIFKELKKRMHRGIITEMETGDAPLIESLELFVSPT